MWSLKGGLKMIIIKKDHLKCCNLCYSDKDDVVSVYLKHDNAGGGQMIQLCDKCRQKLIKALQEVKK